MNLYESPPMLIGRHEWRAVVFKHGAYGRCASYEFRRVVFPGIRWQNKDGIYSTRPPDERLPAWQDMEKWPRYESNDGVYAGCPKGLVALYEKHEHAIKVALSGRTEP